MAQPLPLHRTGPASVVGAARDIAAALGIAVAALVLSGCGRAEPAARPVPLPDGAGTALPASVVLVIDGDTLDVRIAGHGTERVRLLGIDTPETVQPDHPVDCYGPEASARTKALLPPGTPVLVQRDEEVRDRYGRLLVYLWRRADGLFVNRVLVDEGLARPLSIEPNTAHRSEFSAAAATARATGTGLWAACPPGPDGGP